MYAPEGEKKVGLSASCIVALNVRYISTYVANIIVSSVENLIMSRANCLNYTQKINILDFLSSKANIPDKFSNVPVVLK